MPMIGTFLDDIEAMSDTALLFRLGAIAGLFHRRGYVKAIALAVAGDELATEVAQRLEQRPRP